MSGQVRALVLSDPNEDLMTRLLCCICLFITACPTDPPTDDAGLDAASDALLDSSPGDTGPSGSDASDDARPGPDAGPTDAGPQPDVIIDAGPPVMVEAVDLLVVLDNSGSMSEEQASLRAEMPALIAALTRGETPEGVSFNPITDLRVGMVSSDMGTGGFNIATCNEPNFGDDGILIRGEDCIPSGPPFLGFRPGEDDAAAFVDGLQCLSTPGTRGSDPRG